MDRVDPFKLDDFAPKPSAAKPVARAQIDQLAEENGFPSRQAPAPAPAPLVKRQRRYTTGRNQQINIKATAHTVARLGRLADELQVPMGELLERALDALEKDIKR